MINRIVKIFYCTAIFSLFLFGLTVKADTDEDFVVVSGVLIEYRGDSANVTIPGNLGITRIGEGVFSDNSVIITVSIPDSVNIISDYAFSGCINLASVTIGNNVKSIGYRAFLYNSLTSVTIPSRVTSIDSQAFYYCEKLTTIEVDSRNIAYTSIDGILYDKWKQTLICYPAGKANKTFNIPVGVMFIGDYAFFSSSNLTSITIPDSIISIGKWAFSKCTSLNNITIPQGVTTIDNNAFYYCSSLADVNISNTVTRLGNEVFSSCNSLTNVTIPNSVRTMGSAMFLNCISLKSVTLPSSITSVGTYTFSNCSNLTSVNIPYNVTNIESFAFSHCTNLKNITIPNYVTNIGNRAFEFCTNLTDINIPNSVSFIGDFTFYNCSSLTDVTIPNSVTSIGECAFLNSSSLTSVIISSNVTNIGYRAFYSCSKLAEARFLGNAPNMSYEVFDGCAGNFKVYYFYGKNGFTTNWYGYSTAYLYTANVKSDYGIITGILSSYKYGETVNLTAEPSIGYIFDSWTDKAGNILSTGETYSFSIFNNVELTANFRDKCDINKDGLVSIVDLELIADNYNTNKTDVDWDSSLDLIEDGLVDIFDLVVSARRVH